MTHPLPARIRRIPRTMIVGGLIIVELKAVAKFEEIHRAQLISYLRAAKLRGGLLINFRVRVLTQGIRRVVLS